MDFGYETQRTIEIETEIIFTRPLKLTLSNREVRSTPENKQNERGEVAQCELSTWNEVPLCSLCRLF